MVAPSAAQAVSLSALVAQAAQQASDALGVKTAVWTTLVDKSSDFAVNLGISIVIVVATIWIAGWADKLVRQGLGRFRRNQDPDPTLQIFAASVARNAVIIIGGIAVLQQLGVKTTSIIAAVGAASLAIGLAMQGALSNVAAGVMILMFRPYRVGDVIECAGRTGKVQALDLFLTELATLDNLKVVVPNGKVFGDVITNHSFHARRRADVIFHIPLASDAAGVMARLSEWVKSDPRILKDPPPLVEVTGMTEMFVEIAVRPWAESRDYAPVKADVFFCARLLQADANAELPPAPRPGAPGPPGAPPQPAAHHAFNWKAPALGRR
jgi:small conductance mechanosensitive channel